MSCSGDTEEFHGDVTHFLSVFVSQCRVLGFLSLAILPGVFAATVATLSIAHPCFSLSSPETVVRVQFLRSCDVLLGTRSEFIRVSDSSSHNIHTSRLC